MENEIALKMMNVQAELLFVGALYSSPDLYITYGSSIRSKYDFEDKATRFFYDVFEDYYLTFSQEITENKLNTFCSQNIETFKKYRSFKGWSTVKSMMEMADVNDIKNYFNILNDENNRTVVAKHIHNQNTLRFFLYLLMKDSQNNVIPTNTLPLIVDNEYLKNNNDTIKPGTIFHYSNNMSNAEIYSGILDEDYNDSFSDFYYTIPFLMKKIG